MEKCLHKNIVITEKSYYKDIKEGLDNCEDLGKYFFEGTQEKIYCEDCGEYVE